VARLLSLLLVLGLVGGTAAAFAITEGLKLEKSPITRTHVDKLISPGCGCAKDRAAIDFSLRHGDRVTATIVRQNEAVATLSSGEYHRRGLVELSWNGRDSSGSIAPNGSYKLRVHLATQHQTITLPNSIRVDSTPPSIVIRRIRPLVFSPDNDGRADYVTVAFGVSEPARPLLYVNGKLAGRGRLERSAGKVHWFGRLNGRRVRPGVYRVTLEAEDRAGNVSKPTRAVRLRLRYIALGREVVRVRPGARFGLRISTDAKVVRWLLHGRTGRSAPAALELRAPKRAGRYRLFVTAAGHSQAAVVVVAKQ
jgi:hypothetical protein